MPAPNIPLNAVPNAPGVYPILQLEGAFSTEIPNPGRCYLLFTGSKGTTSQPVRVTSLAEFLSVFDLTPLTPTIAPVTMDAVQGFFDTTGTIGELWAVRVPGTVAPIVPSVASWIAALNSFDDERDTHGFIVAPEVFALVNTAANRVAIVTAIEAFCSSFDFQWCQIVDQVPNPEFYAATPTNIGSRTIVPSHPNYLGMVGLAPTLVGTTGAAQIAFMTTDSAQYSSPAGHTSYIGNWAVNSANRLVSPAILQVAVAQVRYFLDSFRVAPAGVKAPVKGMVDVAFRFTKAHQSTLNGLNINILRFLSTYGVCVYGARTLYKQDSAWRYMHVRVIFNVITAALKSAYQPMVFDPVDGAGVTFQRAKQIATQILNRFWQAGVLYGQTPAQAYLVRCDASNNPAFDLELGRLRIDVYAAPCGVAERVLVGVFRVPIGQVPLA